LSRDRRLLTGLRGDTGDAIAEALKSVKKYLDQGFLKEQKLFIGPQIPKTTPRYEELSLMKRASR
jgi:hypothetical protein